MRLSLTSAMIVTSTLAIAGFADAATPDRHHFGETLQGNLVEHEFILENDSDQPVRISGVELTPPLSLARTPARIPPRSKAKLPVKLDTKNLHGEYRGQILVKLDAGDVRAYALDGKVVPPIEVVPMPAFFIATSKGVAKSASLEIVNREQAPLTLQVPPGAPYAPVLETLDPGKRYRLTVTVPADAPPGRKAQRLELRTSSERRPTLFVGLNSVVRERVYTFPDSVDLGLVHRDRRGGGNSQTLMVYQSAGERFRVDASTDVPGLAIDADPGPKGDRVQVTVSVTPGAQPGPVKGTLLLRTNDPEFPELRVPVSGTIQ
jgi:hypothetical protein